MSSWLERLNRLTLPTTTNETYQYDAVFVDGSKFIKKSLLQEIATEYSWVAVSKTTFDTLYTMYNQNITKVLSHLINDRTNLMIYENSNESLRLIQIVQDYLAKSSTITLNTLMSIYKKCCNALQNSSMRKSILILDCRRNYFSSYDQHYENELYLHTFAHLAMLNKRYLFPFMEVVIIKSGHSEDVNAKTDAYHRKLDDLLQQNLYASDKILKTFNKNIIKSVIVNAHKSKCLSDLELF